MQRREIISVEAVNIIGFCRIFSRCHVQPSAGFEEPARIFMDSAHPANSSLGIINTVPGIQFTGQCCLAVLVLDSVKLQRHVFEIVVPFGIKCIQIGRNIYFDAVFFDILGKDLIGLEAVILIIPVYIEEVIQYLFADIMQIDLKVPLEAVDRVIVSEIICSLVQPAGLVINNSADLILRCYNSHLVRYSVVVPGWIGCSLALLVIVVVCLSTIGKCKLAEIILCNEGIVIIRKKRVRVVLVAGPFFFICQSLHTFFQRFIRQNTLILLLQTIPSLTLPTVVIHIQFCQVV